MADTPSSDRAPDGKFAAGNRQGRGRVRGSANRAPAVRHYLDEHGGALVEKAVAVALAGSETLLKAFLDRLLPSPRGRLISLPVPLPSSPEETFDIVLEAVARSEITPDEGQALASLLTARQAAVAVPDILKRIAALEALSHGNGSLVGAETIPPGGAGFDQGLAAAPADPPMAAAAVDRVVAGTAEQHVIARVAGDGHVAGEHRRAERGDVVRLQPSPSLRCRQRQAGE
jgi:hypothetical protein